MCASKLFFFTENTVDILREGGGELAGGFVFGGLWKETYKVIFLKDMDE